MLGKCLSSTWYLKFLAVVSAINANGVTVNVTELTEDIEGSTVEVKDSKGNVVAVEVVDLSAGETTVEYTFVSTVKDEDLVGVWTVDGVEFNLSLATSLTQFEETNSQIELFGVLGDLGIENLESGNAFDYLDGKQDFLDDLVANDKELTVAAIQAYVDEVNASKLTTAEKNAAAQAVVKAVDNTNNIELKNALAHKAFTKVNNAWIEDITSPGAVDGYATELALALLDEDSTAADVQAVLDAVNEAVLDEEISELDVDAFGDDTSVDKTKLAKLKTLIETYGPVDEDGAYVDTDNQTAIDNINQQMAVADVLAATTASKFKATVTTLAGIANTPGTSDIIDLEDYVDANGKAYIDTIKDLNSTNPNLTPGDYSVTGKVNLATELASLILEANDVAADKGAVSNYSKLETAAANVIATPTASNKSKYVAALQAVGIKQVSSNTANVAEYIKTDGTTLAADLIEAEAAGVTGTADVAAAKSAIQAVVDEANLDVVQVLNVTNIIASLNVLELKNVVAANAAAYAADGNGDIAGASDADEVQDAIDAINEEVAIEKAVAAINKAETATQVKTALDSLANEGEVIGYLNVTAADRIFIAEQVLDARNDIAGATKEFADETEVGTAVTAATEARTGTLIAANALVISDDLTDIADVLLLAGHESLTGVAGTVTAAGAVTAGSPTANDTLVADKFITSVGFDDLGAIKPQFRSIFEIRTALTNATK